MHGFRGPSCVTVGVWVSPCLLVSMHLSSGVPSGLPCGVHTRVSAFAHVFSSVSRCAYCMVPKHLRDSKDQFLFYKDCADGIV